MICDLDGHLILSHRVGMGNMFGGWVGVLRSECDDQSAVPFVSMSVVGGGAADIVNQQVTVKRRSAL